MVIASAPRASTLILLPKPDEAFKILTGLIKLNEVISVSTFSHVKSILVVSFIKNNKLPSKPVISASVLTFLEPALTIEEISIPSVVFWNNAALNNIAPSSKMLFVPISNTAVSS